MTGRLAETGLLRSWLSGFLYNVGQLLHQLLVFTIPAAVKTGRKYGNNLQHILRQLFLKGRLITLIDDNHFAVACFAQSEYQFRTKSEQAVFMGDDQTFDLAG